MADNGKSTDIAPWNISWENPHRWMTLPAVCDATKQQINPFSAFPANMEVLFVFSQPRPAFLSCIIAFISPYSGYNNALLGPVNPKDNVRSYASHCLADVFAFKSTAVTSRSSGGCMREFSRRLPAKCSERFRSLSFNEPKLRALPSRKMSPLINAVKIVISAANW